MIAATESEHGRKGAVLRVDATTTNAPRAVVIGSLGWSLVNFRLDLMRRLQSIGYEVIALAAGIDEGVAETLRRNRIRYREVPIDRTGTNPLRDLRTLASLVSILRAEAPGLVIAYTMKPILYGCLAAQFLGVPARFALFTGLGYGFMEEAPRGRRRWVRDISVLLHQLALRRITAAFCYNSADRADIRRFRLIPARVPLHELPGSGVDTKRFTPTPVPEGVVRFLFVGRLLRSKGLEVLSEASARLKARGRAFEVQILGPTDGNPDAIEPARLKMWHAQGLATWLGQTRDVSPFLQACTVFVLPTMLREGIPRSILEAMACGRPVITTDAPGCGTSIEDGVSGFVVPQGDAAALAQAMERFIEMPELARRMGEAARAQVCRRNDVHFVNTLLLQHMGVERPHGPPTAAGALEGVPAN
jgi:glycosyltransferase involved in cell wall biosynthesis